MPDVAHNTSFSVKRLSSVIVAGQDVLSQKLNIIANDLANSGTTGFKSVFLKTKDRERSSPDGTRVSYPTIDGTTYDFSQGGIKTTGVQTHVALMGRGFFKMQTLAGVKYSRNGEFAINPIGQLIDNTGNVVLSDSDSPLVIPENAKSIAIDSKGVISTNGNTIGKLGVVQFSDDQLLKACGNSFFDTDQEELPSAAMVSQGVLELSNVCPVQELVNMMEVEQRFINLQKALDEYDKNMKRTISADKGTQV
jgi:flagellar basal-body rod protein FlgF